MSDFSVFHFIAYLDPGTGSLLLQFLFGAVLGTGMWFRRHVIAAVASIFHGGETESEEASREAAPELSEESVTDATASTEETRETGETEEAPEEVPAATH